MEELHFVYINANGRRAVFIDPLSNQTLNIQPHLHLVCHRACYFEVARHFGTMRGSVVLLYGSFLEPITKLI